MGTTRTSFGWRDWATRVPLVALTTFLVMSLTYRLDESYGAGQLPVYPIWPSAGVNMGMLFLLGARCWPGVALGAAAANLLRFEGMEYHASYTLLVPWGNALEAWLGVTLLGRLRGDDHPLRTLLGAVRFILLAGLVASALGGLLSVALVHAVEERHWEEFPFTLLEWNLSSLIAVLVIVPVMIVWRGRTPVRWTRTRAAQALLLGLLLGIAQGWLFRKHAPGAWIPPDPMVLIALPFVMWAGSQFGAAGSACAVLFAAATAIAGTIAGLGPFDAYSQVQRLLVLQAYLVVIAVVGIIVGAVSEERESARRALQRRAEFDRLLFDELNHRVRNTLASLLAIIDLGKEQAPSVEEYAALVSGRVHAMARVHDLLTDHRWKPVAFRDVIGGVAVGTNNEQVEVSGERVMLAPAQATAVGMILHELFANARKHGALATPDGKVRISWACNDDDRGRRRLRWEWVETGAPARPVDLKPGDGLRLINGLARSDLRGRADLSITGQGVHHRFETVLEAALPEPTLA